VKIETASVHDDEPAYGLREEPRLMPGPDGSSRWRWVQTVFILRGDAIAAHTRDFGPAEDYRHVTPLMMPSFGDDTVAQLREHAGRNRQDTYWRQRAKEQRAGSTLIRDHIEQLEMRREYVRRNHRTVKEITRAHR
jgi:hypothetical protein